MAILAVSVHLWYNPKALGMILAHYRPCSYKRKRVHKVRRIGRIALIKLGHHTRTTAQPFLGSAICSICNSKQFCRQFPSSLFFHRRAQCLLNATFPSSLPCPSQYLLSPLRVASSQSQGYPQLMSPPIFTKLPSTFLTCLVGHNNREKDTPSPFSLGNHAATLLETTF